MNILRQKIKNWVIKVQNSNESVKRKYLTIATVITMIVIIGLWLIYLKSTISSFNQAAQPASSQTSETQFWQIFKNGLNIVSRSIKENIQNIASQIFKGNTIDIK